jgi:hypothetical protein
MRVRLIVFGRAIAAMGKTFFQRKSPVTGYSSNGFGILRGWGHAPEEDYIELAKREWEQRQIFPRLALYGIDGPHRGELIPLPRASELIGTDTDATTVITPRGLLRERFRLVQGDEPRLIAETGQIFTLNGREQTESQLIDYDELEILGNKFLVLTMPLEGRTG